MTRRFTPQPAGAPALGSVVRQGHDVIPNRLYIVAPGFTKHQTKAMADKAVALCRTLCPKLSGRAASGIKAYWGDHYFGVHWDRPYLWYQEGGTGPFTMRNLAGKTIPMWVDDWTGELHRASPKSKTRIAANGRRQILIFRKAGKIGARKRVAVRDSKGRLLRWRSVPQSYPGAPGRIQHRQWMPPDKTTGRIARVISRPHVGVRWRNPGLMPREFMQHALQSVAQQHGIINDTVYATYGRS